MPRPPCATSLRLPPARPSSAAASGPPAAATSSGRPRPVDRRRPRVPARAPARTGARTCTSTPEATSRRRLRTLSRRLWSPHGLTSQPLNRRQSTAPSPGLCVIFFGKPPPPPQTKVTIVQNKIYKTENLVGPFLGHQFLPPPPPPQRPLSLRQTPVCTGQKLSVGLQRPPPPP